MKRELYFLLAVLITVTSAACTKKLNEVISQDVKFCPVLQLESLDPANPGSPTDQIVIHYNTAGNPVEMLDLAGGSQNTRDFHFRYDRFNRLTDYFYNPSNTNETFEWHAYTYPSPDRVVDSVYGINNGALITDPKPTPESFVGVIVHRLDKEGRVIEDDETEYGVSQAFYFQYDARGNLVREGVRYDDRLNPYLTNEVWRFIYEDYSLNNPLAEGFFGAPVTITKYNAFGLPQIIEKQVNLQVTLFSYYFFPDLQITYGCDAGKQNTADSSR